VSSSPPSAEVSVKNAISWRHVVVMILVLAAGASAWAGREARAQIPDKFKNLKVLPKKIAKQDLVETMRGFSFALGVRCGHCHVAQAAQSAGGEPKLDFASDSLQAKRTARQMLKMVKGINTQYIGKLEHKATISVQCVTCHHGIARPEPLGVLLAHTVADSGSVVAIARYRALRERYYGSAAYDFGETSLNTLAEGMMKKGKAADALPFLELNAEYHAESGWLQSLLGDAYVATGDKDKARAAYEKALAANPDNPRVKKRLEELGGAATH
jgi:tetratricopeptide (TPR) repeat protein